MSKSRQDVPQLTILGQKNAQNMPRYYIVEQGKNTDWKRSEKVAELNFNF